jgi:hypothetical protein
LKKIQNWVLKTGSQNLFSGRIWDLFRANRRAKQTSKTDGFDQNKRFRANKSHPAFWVADSLLIRLDGRLSQNTKATGIQMA